MEDRPVAVVGVAEGDQHDLGARAIRALLERDGWRVYFLGGNVPVEDFARIQQAQVADLVCISFRAGTTLPALPRALGTLANLHSPRHPYALAVGGSFDPIDPGDLSIEAFQGFTLSGSAQEFQAWLRSRFPGLPNGQSRRIA